MTTIIISLEDRHAFNAAWAEYAREHSGEVTTIAEGPPVFENGRQIGQRVTLPDELVTYLIRKGFPFVRG